MFLSMHNCGPLEGKKISYPPSKKSCKNNEQPLRATSKYGDARVTTRACYSWRGIATKPLQTIQVHHQTLRPGSRSHIWENYKRLKHSNKNLIDMDNIEERKGYKITYYLLYFQRYECFRTENHKKWLNSVGRCVLMVLAYLNTLGTHGASKKMIFFSLLTLNALRAS